VPPWNERDGDGRRIGVFGGTFDPPHVGHLVTAVNVRHALGLDEVLMVVANRPWQKERTRTISTPSDRLAMVQAAVEGVAGVVASAIEIDRGGVSYTADTLAALGEQWPDATLFTIIGDDAAAAITSWERVEDVVTRSRLVVVDRPGVHVTLPDGFDFLRVEVPRLEVSSTDLRARCVDGRPLDFLVPPTVQAVIERRGLYR
jgi:nicotinate-nucleotide adenylyltransferase